MFKFKSNKSKEYGNDLFDIRPSYTLNANVKKSSLNVTNNKINLEKFYVGFGVLIVIIIVCAVIYFIANGNSFTNHNNGICDYCDNLAGNRLGNEEFCDNHYIDRMGDIIEWSSENK